jgi:uncharacterized membrane protein (DUF441 family)
VTFTATVTGAGAAGTVQFKDGGNNLGSAQSVAGGHASVTTTALTIGTHSISAAFTPTDSSAFTASTAAGITYVISAPAATSTSTALAASPASPAVSGISVTFSATVTPTAAGTVQFKDGANNLGSAQSVVAGQASISTTVLSVGSHSITAVFVPTDPAAFTGSTSPPLTYVISPAPAQNTTTTLGASPTSPSTAGQSVTFTATVTPTAAGTVQFKDGANNLGSPQSVVAGQASVSTSALSVATHPITAAFTPANPAAFNASTSTPLSYTVNAAPAQPTSTTLSATPTSPATSGTSVTFTATVSPAAAGSVQFKDGANNLGSAQNVVAGQASVSSSTLTVGTHSITAAFTPTDPAAFVASTSSPATYVINPAVTSTSTALSASPGSPVTVGTPVTFTASVTPSGAAGTVQFKDGGTNLGSPQTVSGGQATLSTSALTAGAHSITAVFTPTDAASFGPSTSSALSFTVNAATGSDLGTLTFSPATGADTSPILVTTHSTGTPAGCPAGASSVQATINGPTGWSNVQGIGNTTSDVSNTADFSIPLADTMSGLASSNGLTIVAGRYDFTMVCQDSLGTQSFGSFTGSLFFTDATHYQSTDPANTVTTTTTSLTASPADRQDLGKPITLTATVTPSSSVGAVQFKDTVGGVTTNLGAPVPLASAPLVVTGATAQLVSANLVTVGTAKKVVSLPFGLHTFGATFIPTNSKQFSSSVASSVVYVVALPAPPKLVTAARLIGSGHIDTTLVCAATFKNATSYTYNWFRNGKVIHFVHTSNYKLGTADRVTMIACQVIAKNLGGSTTSTSRPKFVGLYSFKLLKPPVIFGKHVVGQTLIACPGRWAPTPKIYGYEWLRDGKAIRGANKQLYKVTTADMGHKLSVKVTVQSMFYYAASAVSRTV